MPGVEGHGSAGGGAHEGDGDVADVAVVGGPGEEVAGSVGARTGQQPGIDVALADPGQGEVMVGKPVKQRDRGAQVLACGRGRRARGRAAGGAGAKPVGDVPGGVGGPQAPVSGTADRRQCVGGSTLEPTQVVVAVGQNVVCDEHAAQVVGDSWPWVGVERVVGQGDTVGGDVCQQRRTGAVAQPVQRGPGHGGVDAQPPRPQPAATAPKDGATAPDHTPTDGRRRSTSSRSCGQDASDSANHDQVTSLTQRR